VIVDHEYNIASRVNDDALPGAFAALTGRALYEMPLVHAGGNQHVDSAGRGYATRLVVNQNPTLGDAGVANLWSRYLGVGTTFFEQFPPIIDATRHIDMWMQVLSNTDAVISRWPVPGPGDFSDQPYLITEDAALAMAVRGYAVHRVPARAFTVQGIVTHFTYTNMIVCNGVALVPEYAEPAMQPLNAGVVQAYQQALPGKTVIPVAADALATLGGVLHCVAMHVPANLGGENPAVYVRTFNAGGEMRSTVPTSVRWLSDDDEGVQSVDVLLSLDGGGTWATLAAGVADTGKLTFLPPPVPTRHARVRVIVRDAEGRTAVDTSDAPARVITACPADYDGSGAGPGNSAGAGADILDIFAFLQAWFGGQIRADYDGLHGVDVLDIFEYLNAWFAGC
jgi:hypothetical protein